MLGKAVGATTVALTAVALTTGVASAHPVHSVASQAGATRPGHAKVARGITTCHGSETLVFDPGTQVQAYGNVTCSKVSSGHMEIYLQRFIGSRNVWLTYDQDSATDPTPTYVFTNHSCGKGDEWRAIGSWNAVTPDGVIGDHFFTVGPHNC